MIEPIRTPVIVRWLLTAVLLAFAIPSDAWEFYCSEDVCAVRNLDVTNNFIVLGQNDGKTKLTMIIGDPSWERFAPMDGSQLSVRVSAEGDPLSLDEHGEIIGKERMFLFVFDDREIARQFISLLRSEARQVQFEFDIAHVTTQEGTSDLSPKFDPTRATFFLDGFEDAWNQYCEVSPLDWLCAD